jgi:hypothetical protein
MMRSNVKDFEFFDQSYVEEMIRQVFPKVKINNVVPWSFTVGNKSGTDAFSKTLEYSESVLYFGTLQGNSSLVNVYAFDDLTKAGVAFVTYPITSPLLFSKIDLATPTSNIRLVVFTGWKIIIENEVQNPNPPTPPPTPPAIVGFQSFYNIYANSLDSGTTLWRGYYGAEKVNRWVDIVIKRRDTAAVVETVILAPGSDGNFYKFGHNSIGSDGLNFEIYEGGTDQLVQTVEYNTQHRLPFEIESSLPASMNPVTWEQNAGATFENLDLKTYLPIFKQGNPFWSASNINNGLGGPLNIVTDSGTSHNTSANYVGGLLQVNNMILLAFPGGSDQTIELLQVIT